MAAVGSIIYKLDAANLQSPIYTFISKCPVRQLCKVFYQGLLLVILQAFMM